MQKYYAIILLINIVNATLSQQLKLLANDLVPTAINIAPQIYSASKEKKKVAKLVDFVNQKEESKLLLQHFTAEVNSLSNEIKELDNEIYIPEAKLEFRRLEHRTKIAQLLLKTSMVYRILFDKTFPNMKDKPAMIVVNTIYDKLLINALNKYQKIQQSSIDGDDNECTHIAKLFTYTNKLGSLLSLTDSTEFFSKYLEFLPDDKRLELGLDEAQWYEQKIANLEAKLLKLKE